MSSQIIQIVGELIAAIIVGIAVYLTPKVKAWIEIHASKASQEQILLLVTSFAKAAEQLMHDNDPDGSKRMEYVKTRLNLLGIKITNEIVDLIEGAVWEINNKNKVAKNGNS